MLIIADGWDELGESEQQEGSFLYQLIFNSMMSVIVTSRPSASAPLHPLPCIDRFVEVRGFNKEHIVEYIQSEFTSDQGKAGRLLEQLKYNPLVESVCSIPLNCAIICHLWHTVEKALPATVTELYTKIILAFVLRNIRKIDAYSSILSLSSFCVLPADLKQPWWLLCEFAFQALEKDQLVFSQEEQEEFFPEGLVSDKRILYFGLLQTAESIGIGISFHFLHLTFQECLAALHLARQSPDEQLDVFRSHKPAYLSRNRFAMVWKFFFGINALRNYSSYFIQQIFECVADNGLGIQFLFKRYSLSLCHCAFEAQNGIINNELTKYLVNHSICSFSNLRTAHDCTAILYVIFYVQECDSMVIDFGNCGVRENQLKKLIDILASKKGKLQIK